MSPGTECCFRGICVDTPPPSTRVPAQRTHSTDDLRQKQSSKAPSSTGSSSGGGGDDDCSDDDDDKDDTDNVFGDNGGDGDPVTLAEVIGPQAGMSSTATASAALVLTPSSKLGRSMRPASSQIGRKSKLPLSSTSSIQLPALRSPGWHASLMLWPCQVFPCHHRRSAHG